MREQVAENPFFRNLLDLSEMEGWPGQLRASAQLNEPVTRNGIQRWAQGMQNPNPPQNV